MRTGWYRILVSHERCQLVLLHFAYGLLALSLFSAHYTEDDGTKCPYYDQTDEANDTSDDCGFQICAAVKGRHILRYSLSRLQAGVGLLLYIEPPTRNLGVWCI